MEKPNALCQVLEELRADEPETSVVTVKSSYAEIFVTAGGDPIRLTRQECELLFSSPETVEMLHEALNAPTDAAIELHLVNVEEAVQDALERTFSAVDDI